MKEAVLFLAGQPLFYFDEFYYPYWVFRKIIVYLV